MTEPTDTDPGTLAGRTEIAEITGLSRQRVHQLIHGAPATPPFPDPIDVLGDGKIHVFRRLDIAEWWAAYSPPANG